ncbi:MAG: hypothetical protein ACD_37C00183G0002 [uncultured bacterium]|nr:MAG: hypothetical protein ACD_37C00183G0002 [uncultured bacterium]
MSPKLIYLVLALLSVILAIRLANHLLSVKKYPPGTSITFETQVLAQPKISSRGQQVSLSLPNSQRVSVRMSLNPLLSYGDRVKIEGKVEYFEAEDGAKVAFINYPRFELVKKGTANLFYNLRENIVKFFSSNLSPTHSSLMLGIVFGIKQDMPEDFYKDLQRTGLMHVVAASGMNVTMVGGFLASFFALFLRRQVALILSILGIFFYAFMAGFEPSIVRASIMGVLVFGSQLIGRQNTSFLGLFMAAFIMLFINPSLVLDIGFQLSFMATFGLIYLRPIFYISVRMREFIKKSIIGEDLATTLTAQLFTLPILLVNFGSYSLISILVNAIALWTVPVIMIFGALAVLAGLIAEPIGRLILYFNLPFLLYFEKIVTSFGQVGSQIELKTLPNFLICGYYLLLISLTMLVKKKG